MTTLKTQEYWSENHIASFWDWVSKSSYWQTKYFTKQLGKGLKNFIETQTSIDGKYLDYGCGSGHFLELMIREKETQCYGLEHSPNSKEIVSNKLNRFDNWRGCELIEKLPTNYEKDYFDLITFIETIEHLKDDMLESTLKEMKRILKPGGKIIITTPFNEKLIDNHVYCPFCDSEFHRMQHMRSFNVKTMEDLLIDKGFIKQYCNNVNFSKWDTSKNKFRLLIQNTLQSTGIKKYVNNNKPHLVGIFTKD